MGDLAEIFPRYDPTQRYGNMYPCGTDELSYRSDQIEWALRADDVRRIEAAEAAGWLDRNTRAFDSLSLIRYALLRGAVKCADHLRSHGFPDE